MRRFAIIGLVLLCPLPFQFQARAEEGDAKQLAQKILDEGAALFAKRDSEAMSRTYAEEGARVALISKDNDSLEYKFDVREGRLAIRDMYDSFYNHATEQLAPRNTVEFARRIGPDLLMIQGVFEPTAGADGAYPFVQTRKKEGDRWLIISLQLYIVPKS